RLGLLYGRLDGVAAMIARDDLGGGEGRVGRLQVPGRAARRLDEDDLDPLGQAPAPEGATPGGGRLPAALDPDGEGGGRQEVTVERIHAALVAILARPAGARAGGGPSGRVDHGVAPRPGDAGAADGARRACRWWWYPPPTTAGPAARRGRAPAGPSWWWRAGRRCGTSGRAGRSRSTGAT